MNDAVVNQNRYVLPDHNLLRLVERPPSDMASLAALFQPIPPVVRKRAKELLDIIKNNLGGPSKDPATPKIEGTAMVVENAMVKDKEIPSTEPIVSGLWSNGKCDVHSGVT